MNKAEDLVQVIQDISKKLRNIKEEEIKSIELNDFSINSFKYIEEIHNLKSPTFIELANKLGYSKPTVTLMVANLIKKGYVTKTNSEHDKRVYYLSLTAKGEEVITSYKNIYIKFIDQVSKRFNEEEMNTLITLLKRM